jgi:predicted RNA binding protein YcfA (HicA-like mRNA interferase family)
MSARLPVVTSRKVIKALEQAGFFVHHTTGSHSVLRHETDVTKRVTVPMHNGDLKIGTLRHLIKQSRLSVSEFSKLL